MAERRIQTFEEFWPFYVREHSRSWTRTLHFAGTTAAMGCLAVGLLTNRHRWLALAPIVGYGPSWIGHFFVEKNRPATFKYPLWSLRADLKMWSLMARGQMDAEVDRIMSQPPREAPVDDGGTGQIHASDDGGNPPDRGSMN